MLVQLSYENVVLPLAELEARQLSLIQCCAFPKMLSPQDSVRRASAEAEQNIDAHILSCRCFWIRFVFYFIFFSSMLGKCCFEISDPFY